MFQTKKSKKYRDDIDGLRAIAIIAVLIFHFFHFPNGYLGVDIFFVISGYLITSIIYNELNQNKFSLINFYLRRIRRLFPLVLFFSLTSLLLGIGVMLPDDLENLAQSVIATNFFSNNILQAITTRNYWDIVNEYKPLMHTWSLAIEEQFYLLYPFFFLLIRNKSRNIAIGLLCLITIMSLTMFLSPFKEYEKFYFLPFRFFEITAGGIVALVLNNKVVKHDFNLILIVLIVAIMCFDFSFLPSEVLLLLTVVITSFLLATSNSDSKIASWILENRYITFIGKISFSLYMWHHFLLAFAKYFIVSEVTQQIFVINSFSSFFVVCD